MAKKSVLIIEDVVLIAEHIKLSLLSNNYDVAGIASNAEEAMTLLENEKVELILLDIILEGTVSGTELAKIIQVKYPDLPYIFLTALSNQSALTEIKRLSPLGYILKPFKEEELITNIDVLLQKHDIGLRLKASERKFNSIVNSINEPVITLSSKGEITFSNSTFNDFFDLNQPVNTTIQSLIPYYTLNNQKVKLPFFSELIKEKDIKSISIKNESNGREFKGDIALSKIIKDHDFEYVLLFKDQYDRIKKEEIKELINQERIDTLIEGQDMERSRVSQELHDGLGQLLTGIQLHFEKIAIKLSNEDDDIMFYRSLIKEAITETDRIAQNLMPAKLEILGLRESLLEMCRNVSKNSSIQINTHFSHKNYPISFEKKTGIFRIVQESINNALKHAKANTIWISFDYDEKKGCLEVSIEDDGVGFDMSKLTSTGLGLKNLEHRAKKMQATIDISSNINMGTTIQLSYKIHE